jgi:hypothetical protein
MTAAGQFCLHCRGHPGPIPVVVKGRGRVVGITVGISVIVIRIPPVRKSECHDVKAKKETAAIMKELVVPGKPVEPRVRAELLDWEKEFGRILG